MKFVTGILLGCASLWLTTSFSHASSYPKDHHAPKNCKYRNCQTIELGPRPFYLVDDMDESPLKDALKQCENGPFYKTDFSIGHRGAPLQFPEHTKESYEAAAKMGAGILECDVTFTKDRELVCRHAQCDLHTTTNILKTPLAQKCRRPFTPADPISGTPASVECCTSDITLKEFKTLCGKMDAFNPNGTTIDEYMDATASWRTDLYSQCGTVLSHKESIALFKSLDVKFTPELKSPQVEMPFEGDYTQKDYASQLIREYRQARVRPRKVWPQSFNLDDVQHWIQRHRRFGRQAVYLDGRYSDPDFDHTNPATWEPNMDELRSQGVRIIAPPTWMLLELATNGDIVPSEYAKQARSAGLDIITWTLDRSPPLATGGGWYYQTVTDAINNDGDQMKVLHVLAEDVGVIGVFTDWPATVTYYANCKGL